LAWSLALTSAVAGLGITLAVQGWRSRITTFDLVTYVHSVDRLLENGTLPQYGDTGSLGALSAPGTAWLLLPGQVLFDDVRLSEYLGAGVLSCATLLGLFLLGRKYFGTRCACLAVLLYGLSATGIFMAGSLWPVARPEFLVWMVYLASQWVARRSGWYLAGALAVWGIGMYVDMAITPALLILPALWFVYRPPLRVAPLLAAVALVFVVWLPYLRFDAPRNFADIRSQLLFEYVLPADYKSAWCDPQRELRAAAEPAAAEAASAGPAAGIEPITTPSGESLGARVRRVAEGKLLSNFETATRIPGGRLWSVLLFAATAASAALLSARGLSREEARRLRPSGWRRDRALVTGLGMTAVGGAAFGLAHLAGAIDGSAVERSLETAGKLLAVGGAGLIAFRAAVAVAEVVLRRIGIELQPARCLFERRLLVISLLVPWLVLFAIAEADKPERFWWLWPVQVLFLAALVTHVLPRLGAPRAVVALAAGLLSAVLLANGQLLDRTAAWRSDGWSGPEAPEVRVVDYVSDRLRADKKVGAAIGYRLFVYRFMAAFHVTNPDYKVGADFDSLFEHRRGISNTNSCAEGFSDADEYRIAQIVPRSESGAPRLYFDVPLDGKFQLVQEFYPYRIYRRV
jgi:hypothetical protein